MRDNDNLHRFVVVLMQYAIVFAVAIAILLLGLAALLIWRPLVLLEILRYGLAIICVVTAIYLITAAVTGSIKSAGIGKAKP